MQNAVQKVAELIDHLRRESLNEQNKCFYCGGFHKTVDCDSAQRKAFHLSLLALSAEASTQFWEEDLGQESFQFENKEDLEHSRLPDVIEKWEELAF
ncbi:MAG: hypothetical protein U5L00_09370 [Desulfovermiculus sp.]|nr:hypothetical protein [Desulfovermiculus sp.]